LNRLATNLPGALITRWLEWIRLFDFNVQHVPRRKYTVADGLSRRPRTALDDVDEAAEIDIDDFINAELNCVRVMPARLEVGGYDIDLPLVSEYSDSHMQIAWYLTTLQRPHGMSVGESRKFKKNALTYLVRDKVLFKRSNKNMLLRRVVDSSEERAEILGRLHTGQIDGATHRGREVTYRRVADRYWWLNCYKDVKSFI